MATRSAWRSRLIIRLPATTASIAVYSSSISRGAWAQSRLVAPTNRASYHRFHSSKESLSLRRERFFAAT